MLSMAVIKSSAAAVSYYEKDDYYREGDGAQDAQGEWQGKGAEKLGLSGQVDREVFKSLLEGQLPNGQLLGVARNATHEHTPGWDLTFSAPKSVSLLAEVGGDMRVIAAHQAAVRSAVGWLEDVAAGTRIKGADGVRREVTGNLAVATFRHDTNRNHDPQLHTHAVVLNVTQRADGMWRSLDSKPLFEHRMAGTNVYRATLALELQRLGYEIDQTHADGRFEVAGVDAQAIREFSTRRAQIVAALDARGEAGGEASARAALMTRSSKSPENRAELAQEWTTRADRLDFRPRELVMRAEQRGDLRRDVSAPVARKALQIAIDRLSDQEAAFTHSRLIEWTLAAGMGTLTVEKAEALIQQSAQAGYLHAAELGQQPGWTTLSASVQEQRIHAAVADGRDALPAAYSPTEAAEILSGSSLNDGQRAAAQLILSSPDRHIGILGRPGTGKTYTLGTVRPLLESRGLELVGMAANAEAARQLQASAHIPSKTLAKHLRVAGSDVARLRSADAQTSAEIRDHYSRQVWVIDEASQVSNANMRRITTLADKLGARTVLIGDPDQLGAIGAGKPFARMLSGGMRHAEMDQILRQTDRRHVDAIRDAIAKDFGAALDKLAPEMHQIPDREQRLRAMVEIWRAAGGNRDQLLMLSSRNSTRTELNEMARDILRKEGKLPGEQIAQQLVPVYTQRADTAVVTSYKPGQVIHFPRALASLGITRGSYARVSDVDQRTGVVRLDLGDQTVAWNPRLVGGGTKTPPQIFQAHTTLLAPGERITWGKNNSALGLANGQELTVLSTDSTKMIVRTEDGRRIEIDRTRDDGRHWEHGYASTIYKSQGKTAEHVLVDASSEDKSLLNQKAFLVAISRQKGGITIFTDDRAKLRDVIDRNSGEKLSALETRSPQSVSENFEASYQGASKEREQLWPFARSRALDRFDLGFER